MVAVLCDCKTRSRNVDSFRVEDVKDRFKRKVLWVADPSSPKRLRVKKSR